MTNGGTESPLTALRLTLHRRSRRDVSLLTIHAPIAEFIQRDGLAGYGAAHEGAGTENTEIAVKIFNLRFARVDWTPLEPVHCKGPDLAVLCHDERSK